VLAGFPEGAQCGPVIPAGEFILGEPDARGEAPIPGPAWARGGSFLSFVQLEQHVEAFRAAMRQQAGLLGLDPEELAARVVGRWRDGAPVSEPPPRLAHVGRARPRWLPEQDVARHRILRRGIPYGAPPGDGHPDAGERGLLFLAYQADLARQFEHVWLQWLNGPNFPGPSAGRDGLVGQAAAPGSVALGSVAAGPVVPTRLASVASIGRAGGPATLRLPEFVSPGYGGYFFAPSKGALAQLAG
jgi:Dyp-type peroxidase family